MLSRLRCCRSRSGGLREQQRAHNDTAQHRFNSIEEKLDELTAIMNRGRGAYAASMMLAAGIGGVLIKMFYTD